MATAPTWASNLSGITATDAADSSEVYVAWNAATQAESKAIGYIIETSLADADSWTERARSSGTSITIGNLSNGTAYDFRVKAYAAVEAEPTTTPADTAEATPTGITVPTQPVIGTISVSGSTVTVPITGDAGVTNYARIIKEDGTVVDTQTRSGDGDIDLTVEDLTTRYYVFAWSIDGGASSTPTNPEVVYVPDTNTAKILELRAELISTLEGSTTLQTLLGTDELGNYPIYHAHHATGLTTAKAMVYDMKAAVDVELNQDGRRFYDITILAEAKPTSAVDPADWLDSVEQELDSLLNMWRPVTTSLIVKHASRPDAGLPTYDVTGQGFEGREWNWRLIVDIK
jgi:hypothetical protein